MVCPQFIGRLNGSYGSAGPYPTASATEIIYGGQNHGSSGYDPVRRFAYPVTGAGPIETFTATEDIYQLAPAADGSLWWVAPNGRVYRRSTHTSAGTDTLIGQPVATTCRLVWSNHDGNLYLFLAAPGWSIDVWRITPGGSISHRLSTGQAHMAVSSTVRAAGDGIWFSSAGFALWRYDIDANTFTQHGTGPFATSVDDTGGLLYVDTGLGSVMRVDPSGTRSMVDCPELYVPGQSSMQGGAEVPGSPGRAVMSHFVEFDAPPYGDWIWEWPGSPPPVTGGWRVGRIGFIPDTPAPVVS